MTHRYLPKTTFGSVEYPGPVSHHAKLLDVMHQQDMDECFNAPNAEQPVLEMAFRKGGGTVPVRGHRVGAAKMLVKIRRRRRRDEDEGVFVTEVMGTIPHSVRFRCRLSVEYS
jgi:general transcription factor 3C polypeptide 5 (transcription factor C subunit 1)